MSNLYLNVVKIEPIETPAVALALRQDYFEYITPDLTPLRGSVEHGEETSPFPLPDNSLVEDDKTSVFFDDKIKELLPELYKEFTEKEETVDVVCLGVGARFQMTAKLLEIVGLAGIIFYDQDVFNKFKDELPQPWEEYLSSLENNPIQANKIKILTDR